MKSPKFYLKRVYREAIAVARSGRDWRHLEANLPETLKVELTNICNANCIFCGYQYETRPKGVMPDALYRRVISEYREMGGTRLSFTPVVGEPLVDPNFVSRVREAKALGFSHIATYTNGILLCRHDLKALLTSGMTHIIVSVAPLERARFERLLRNKQYDQLLEGLQGLLLTNQELGRPVDIELSFRSDVPLKKVLQMEDYQRRIRPYLDDEKRQVSILFQGYDNWGGMIKQEDLLPGMELASVPRFKSRPCSRTFTAMVMWDGRVRACSCRFSNLDQEDGLLIGDLKEASLKEIWFGQRVKRLRQSFVEKRPPITCQNCTMYNPV